MKVDLALKTTVSKSFRVQSLTSRMDYVAGATAVRRIEAELPDSGEEWSVGLIVGPSGSGKSQILRASFGDWADASKYEWSGASFLDDLPKVASVEECGRALAAAGLSDVPAWVVPYHNLSNGQQQRATMARALLETDRIVFDEFTSMLDRVVARTTCMAAAKAVRRTNKRLVVATCHYDVAEWLEADWTLDMATGTLARGRLRRPDLRVSIHPAPYHLWPLFARHHYLTGAHSVSARCFVGVLHIGDESAICAWQSFLSVAGYKGRWRGHRAVVLPEFQGAGIGARFTEACYAIMADEDPKRRLSSVTSSLPLNLARAKSPHWRLARAASHTNASDSGSRAKQGVIKRSASRLTTSWEYIPNPTPKNPETLTHEYAWHGVGKINLKYRGLAPGKWFDSLFARTAEAHAACANRPTTFRDPGNGAFAELVNAYWNGIPTITTHSRTPNADRRREFDPAKSVVTLTGGKDSVHALLREIEIRKPENVLAVYVDKINRSECYYEREAARKISAALGVKLAIVDLTYSIPSNRQNHNIALREQLIATAALPYADAIAAPRIVFGLTHAQPHIFTDTDLALNAWNRTVKDDYGLPVQAVRHPDYGTIDEFDIVKDLAAKRPDLLAMISSCYTQRNFREQHRERLQRKLPSLALAPGCGSCLKCCRINGTLLAIAAMHGDPNDLRRLAAHIAKRHREAFPLDPTLLRVVREFDANPI